MITAEWIQTVLGGAPGLALAGWMLIWLSDAWRAALWSDVGDNVAWAARAWSAPVEPVAFGWRVRGPGATITWRWTPAGPRVTRRDASGSRRWPVGTPPGELGLPVNAPTDSTR